MTAAVGHAPPDGHVRILEPLCELCGQVEPVAIVRDPRGAEADLCWRCWRERDHTDTGFVIVAFVRAPAP